MDDKYSHRLKSLFHKQQVENELDEELESYLQASAAEKEKSGVTPEAARRAALVELGSRNAVKHQVWSSRWESTLDSLLLDMRLRWRALVKSPGFTAIALLSIALAFAATRALIAFVSQGSTSTALSSTPDAAVLLFTLAASLFTGLLFGLAPAIVSARFAPERLCWWMRRD